jgi:NAD(P)-dependent dehydrogenase (short-subunit alcohol dehydrogenase family)
MTTILITGANRGIGLALVKVLAERGDTVIAACRRPENAAELSDLANKPGHHVEILRMDVADPQSIAAAQAHFGERPLDVLVNNAGIISPDRQSTLDMDFDGWTEAFQINTVAPLRIAQAFLPNLRLSAAGKILSISSTMGSMSYARSDRIAYRSTKTALNKVMQGLATDLRRAGIAVSVAHPGWVRTDMGGGGADIAPATSAAGLAMVIDRMNPSDSPRFYNFDGSQLPW